ncbi:MAG TPA: FHA domain-containing protein [Spirochaetota bacterium]|nr:FHA domain-containing protein [Spirochaetota bacterium]
MKTVSCVQSNHDMILLPEHRTKPVLRTAALLLLAACMLTPALAGPNIEIISADGESEFPTVLLRIAVSNGGRGAPGDLTDENIQVYEDGFRVNYVSVKPSAKDAVAASYVLAIDSSKSIRPKELERIKKAARGLIALSSPADGFAVVRFNDEVKIACTLTTARDRLDRCVSETRRHGSRTSLYTALYDSIELLGREADGAKAVIVFSDGRDEGSSLEGGDVVALAKEMSVPVHVVAVRPGKASRRLERIARLSGGNFIRCCTEEDVRALYGTLKSGGSNRYDVRFRSMAAADGKARSVEVRLRYDSIADRDVREVTYRRGIAGVELPALPQILLVALILLIIGLLIGCVFILLRRGTLAIRRAAMNPAGFAPGLRPPFSADEFEAALKRDEEAKLHRDRLVTSQDPEYVYAKAWLVQKDGPEAGKKFPMYWEEITIGRDEENAIVVRDDAVSLRHARIRETKGAYYLFDLASDNGTFLNGKKLLRPRPLYDWDELRMGRTLFIFRGTKIS